VVGDLRVFFDTPAMILATPATILATPARIIAGEFTRIKE